MTTSEVREIVKTEISDNWSRRNAHGCDFKACLVEPYLREFETSGGQGTIRLWVVLEEHPEDHNGYLIVFDEDSRNFGLACTGSSGSIYLGSYGTFLKAFDLM
jgi:hypothetical protein